MARIGSTNVAPGRTQIVDGQIYVVNLCELNNRFKTSCVNRARNGETYGL